MSNKEVRNGLEMGRLGKKIKKRNMLEAPAFLKKPADITCPCLNIASDGDDFSHIAASELSFDDTERGAQAGPRRVNKRDALFIGGEASVFEPGERLRSMKMKVLRKGLFRSLWDSDVDTVDARKLSGEITTQIAVAAVQIEQLVLPLNVFLDPLPEAEILGGIDLAKTRRGMTRVPGLSNGAIIEDLDFDLVAAEGFLGRLLKDLINGLIRNRTPVDRDKIMALSRSVAELGVHDAKLNSISIVEGL